MSKKKSKARVIIPCKFGYLNCWRPGAAYGGNEKYSVSAIISKDDKDTLNKINEALEYVKCNSQQKWGGRIPNNLRMPLHDGDDEKPDDPVYRNTFYINAKSKDRPQIVDENVEPITNQTLVYSGCSGNVSVVFYAYNYNGNRGIAAALGNIQKLEDGEPLNGAVSAKEDFIKEDFLK